ncbi:MAG: Rieske 2Fe-2S domain-containing protein [Verrucomicrobiota bacterium]
MATLPRNCTFKESDWRILAEFWHPIAYTCDISADRPIATQLLDQELVVYRSGGDIVVAKDLCIHRGTQISGGWIEGEEIVCPYHGFRYGKNGACTRVPAQPDAAIPKKLCLKTYPAIDRYGVIWTCLAGRESVHSIPEWPDFERTDLRFFQLDNLEWKSSATRHVENFNDVAHLSWLHKDTFGNPDKPEIPKYDVIETPYGMHFELDYERQSIENVGYNGDPEYAHLSYDLFMPFYTRLHIGMPEGREYIVFDMASPASLRKTKVFFRMARNWDLSAPEKPTLDMQYKILSEDQPMVEAQRPEEIPLDLTEEFHIRADRLSTYYRRALKRLGLGKPIAA